MKLLQTKLARYDAPQIAKAKGVYPYFREITSDQDTVVKINGKKVLMFAFLCIKKPDQSGLNDDSIFKILIIEAFGVSII